MGLFDFFRKRKRKKKSESVSVIETDQLMGLDDVAPSEINPPETRYTKEYQDYLASLEAAEQQRSRSEEGASESDAAPEAAPPEEAPIPAGDEPDKADEAADEA